MKALTIGITGGIGSGKSFVCNQLELLGYKVFYTDHEAKAIIRHHADVRQKLTACVGNALYAPDGKLVKSVLANYLLQSKAHAARVNAIVHAKVLECWQAWVEAESRKAETRVLFMECALLFESGFHTQVNKSVLIAAPLALRIQRVMQRDNISEEQVKHWMSLQMPEADKALRADAIVINANDKPNLEPLFALFAPK